MSTHAVSSSSRLAVRRRSSLTEADLLATRLAVTSLVRAIAKSGVPTSEAAVEASLAKRTAMAAAMAKPTAMAPAASACATPNGTITVTPTTTPRKSVISGTLERLRRASHRKSLEIHNTSESSLQHPTAPLFSSPFNAARARAPSMPSSTVVAVSLDAELGEDYHPPAPEVSTRPRLFRSTGSDPLISTHHLPHISLHLKHKRRQNHTHEDEDTTTGLPSVTEGVQSSSNLFAAAFDLAAPHDQGTPGSSRGTSIASSLGESPRLQNLALATGFRQAYTEDSICPIQKETKRRPPPLNLHLGTSTAEADLPLPVSDRFEDSFPPEGQVKKITLQLEDWQKELTVSNVPPRPSYTHTSSLFNVAPATSWPVQHLRMRSRASSLALNHEAPRTRTFVPADFAQSTEEREPRRKSMLAAAPQENHKKSLKRPTVPTSASSPFMSFREDWQHENSRLW
ncbi:hypothetical protein BCV69DRAFT_76050 [Microstroma glucosiphilum]|uniref:Uncharacterized protein n=1 Tax=Pseudomicrostroma glucosiphilum TaxID=1684307 RepID=A0A316U0U7_9BASI|nr:hypothetical protein BCV69DRAFT_76050 [Pseudomicrostroma glucosiphilum]PWN18494.1 hypothetical protein BCV69DRAFT_76050 [Pseudomicrostroma glucosiphilum]